MRSHDHDHDAVEDVRRSPGRAPDVPAPLLAAAAAGRPDVLGTRGLLALQRAAGNAGTRGLLEQEESPVLGVVGSGGQALDPPVRRDMEQRLGHDFGDVRVHTDDAAHASAEAVGAHAYTVGRDVVFQRDAYDPGSTAGLTTLAHELTHVVQQRSGPVDGTPTGDGVSVSDPSDRFEQEAAATAERVVSAPAPVREGGAVQREASGGAGTASVQRDEDPASGPPEELEEDAGAALQSIAREAAPVQREDVEEEDGPA